MLSTPRRRSLTEVTTIGYTNTMAPKNALALATAWPCSNSQSTMNALMTSTTPTNVCQSWTGACSWSCPQALQDSSRTLLGSCSCRLNKEVTCIRTKSSTSRLQRPADSLVG